MVIDRSGRAKRRWQRRATNRRNTTAETKRDRAGTALGVEGLFNSGAQHQLQHLKQQEIITEDDREAGSGKGPVDLDAGIILLHHREPRDEPSEPRDEPSG